MDSIKYFKNGVIESEILNPNSRFILISYYWGLGKINKNSVHKLTYDQQVERIIKNCQKHKVNYYFMRCPDFEKIPYQIALGYKPDFIEYCFDLFPKYNCIFIDSDLQLLQYPALFEIDADCWFINWNEEDYNCYNPLQIELPGGIMGFGNNHVGRTLIKILKQQFNKKYAEDKSFSGIFTRNFLNIYCRCIWLPITYLYMFDSHTYIPGKGYTKIVTLEEDLKKSGSAYKTTDIVFMHEDFETGALEDVYQEKVGKNRYPPKLNKQMGEKLRCFEVKFINYINFGINNVQSNQLLVDAKQKQKEDIIKIKYIPKISAFPFNNPLDIKFQTQNNKSYFTIISLIDNNVSTEQITHFINQCNHFKFNFIIYTTDDIHKINKPIMFYNILQDLQKPILYLDIHYIIKKYPILFNITNMDFMTINLNNQFGLSKCYDDRILKPLNDNIFYFNYNKFTLDFLLIWADQNKSSFIKNHVQHRSLEYAFNISNALNRLRCYWLPKDYIYGNILTFDKTNKHKFLKLSYKDTPKVKSITYSLQQCGLKPARNEEGDATYKHYYGSKGRMSYHKYSQLFLEFGHKIQDYSLDFKIEERHIILNQLVEKFGLVNTIKKLNNLYNTTKNAKELNKLKKDITYIQRKFSKM